MELTLTPEELELKKKNYKGLLYVGLVGIVMAFGAFISAIIVGTEGKWLNFELPVQFTFSVGLVILGSAALYFSAKSYSKGNQLFGLIGLLVAFGFGIGFGFSQFSGWNELIDSGIYPIRTSRSAEFFYAITAFHFLHVIVGYIVMMVTLSMAYKKRYNSENYLGVQLCGIYWHFLGLLWVVIFMFLAFYS